MSDLDKGYAVIYSASNQFYFAGDLQEFKQVEGLMTGQEWYDRFFKETEKDAMRIFTKEEQKIADTQGKEVVVIDMFYAAAKKAAGIE